MSTVAQPPMYGWDTIPWKKLRRSVWKLQKRIYQATLQTACSNARPNSLVPRVRMTNVKSSRSRMTGNCHVRF